MSLKSDLAAYVEHPYRAASIDPALLAWPLPDEPHVDRWRHYAARAARSGLFPVLREAFPQLAFPVRTGISEEPAYRAATRRGVVDAAGFGGGVVLERPDALTLTFSGGAGGSLPVLTAGSRADFVALVCAFTERNEAVPVPESMGACFVKGLINWDRVAAYRAAWEAANGTAGDEDAWREEMGRLSAQKPLYQDRFILLSRGPYSGLPAREAGLDEDAWLDRSLIIRREHELTHNFTWRLFGLMRSHATDEIVADFAGLVAAYGRYPDGLARRFLGIEALPAIRPGGRLANYRGSPPLSDESFATAAEMVDAAIANIARVASTRLHAAGDALALARLTLGLTLLSLPELAAADMPALLDGRIAETAAMAARG